jgi:Cof subfamily protein (haloacid dehalogenase superfamily)
VTNTVGNGTLLIAVDVDGTLVDTEVEEAIGGQAIAALEAVRRAGHVVALCTGRNLASVSSLLERSAWFPADLPLVLLNGALVWGGEPRRELACHMLEGPLVQQLVALFKRLDTVPMVYGTDSDGGILRHESRPLNSALGRYLDMRRTRVGRLETVDDLLALPWSQALEVGTIDTRSRIEALTAAIGAELGTAVRVINTRSLLGGGAYFWAEVFHRDGGKGAGLTTLAGALGIPLARCIAIGDNYNDLDMFAVSGVSVAMGNSPDDVKAAADHLADDVTRGGAAVVLEAIAAGAFPAAIGGAQREECGP